MYLSLMLYTRITYWVWSLLTKLDNIVELLLLVYKRIKKVYIVLIFDLSYSNKSKFVNDSKHFLFDSLAYVFA